MYLVNKLIEKTEKIRIIIEEQEFKELVILLFLGMSLVSVAIYNYFLQPWTLDDAFIAFRYAENFAEGKGIVYNEGEYVEGYTCFLWVVLLAGLKKLGMDLPLTSKILGTLFTFATIILMSQIHKIIVGTSWFVSLVGVILLGTFGTFTSWAMSGMETSMTAFLIFLVFLLFGALVSRNSNSKAGYFMIGVITSLVAMSRPDAGIIFPVITLASIINAFKDRKWVSPILIIIGFSIVFVPYFIWRYSYYGWLLPNTFYVKVGSTFEQLKRGFFYTRDFLFSCMPIFAIFIYVQSIKFKSLPTRGIIVFSMSLAMFLNILYVIAVGGDCMPAYRFFTPFAPLLIMVCAYAFSISQVSVIKGLIIVLLIATFNVWQLQNDRKYYKEITSDTVAEKGMEVGLWLRENAPPDAVVATNTAGSVAYYSRLKVIDMLGLNDEHIAHRKIPTLGKGSPGHEKGDGKYVLSRKPDYIMFSSPPGSKEPRTLLSDREIASSPEFRENYVFKQHSLPSGKILQIYERKK